MQTFFGICLVLLLIAVVFILGWILNKLILLATVAKSPWAAFALITFSFVVLYISSGDFMPRPIEKLKPDETQTAKRWLLDIIQCFASQEDVAEFLKVSRTTIHKLLREDFCTLYFYKIISEAHKKLSTGIYEKAKAKSKDGKLRGYDLIRGN